MLLNIEYVAHASLKSH